MTEPRVVLPSEIDSIPDRPAVFLLWPAEGAPYLARTALLRRRLKRLISDRDRVSRVLNLRGVAERIEYWPVGSQLASSMIHLELARRHFPDDWPRLTRLRPPALIRMTLDNPFPRLMITTKLGRGVYFGPFSSRAAAERYEAGVLDLFQMRRCEENLSPSLEHPGCIYGEMNRCMRPCQQAVSMAEYRGETARVEQFLRTRGASLIESTEAARDRASAEMQFEEAERLHQRTLRIREVRDVAGDLAAVVDQLSGVAVTPSAHDNSVELWFLRGGSFAAPVRLELSETAGAGQSMDHRIRDLAAGIAPEGPPNAEHLAILLRWRGSSWRDGEWIGFEALEKIPYRRIVNAIGRVAKAHEGRSLLKPPPSQAGL